MFPIPGNVLGPKLHARLPGDLREQTFNRTRGQDSFPRLRFYDSTTEVHTVCLYLLLSMDLPGGRDS